MLRARGRKLRVEGRVWIERACLNALVEDAIHHAPRETGGVLLGYGTEGEFVIRQLLLGGPNATRRSDSFRPDGRWQEREIALAYAASGRTDRYLGDWHSHPDGDPAPSTKDRRILRLSMANSKSAVLAK